MPERKLHPSLWKFPIKIKSFFLHVRYMWSYCAVIILMKRWFKYKLQRSALIYSVQIELAASINLHTVWFIDLRLQCANIWPVSPSRRTFTVTSAQSLFPGAPLHSYHPSIHTSVWTQRPPARLLPAPVRFTVCCCRLKWPLCSLPFPSDNTNIVRSNQLHLWAPCLSTLEASDCGEAASYFRCIPSVLSSCRCCHDD